MTLISRPNMIRAGALLVALSVAGVACGADSTGSGQAGVEAGGGGATAAPDTIGPSPAGSGDEEVAQSAFPSLDVVRIDDGTTLNLAEELAGGDTPVLLWFWAPH